MISIVVLAAGKGTRMNDSNLPKVCRKVGNLTMIEHVVNTSKKLNGKIIVVVSNENIDIIKNTLNDTNIKYTIQKELNGTASAVLSAQAHYENTDILVLLGDVPLLKYETLKEIISSKICCILGFEDEDINNRFGRIVLQDEFQYDELQDNDQLNELQDLKNELNEGTKNRKVIKIVEYNDTTEEERKIKIVNSGILFLKKEHTNLLNLITNDNVKKEYYLTDIVKILSNNNIPICMIKASKQECMGVNNPNDLETIHTFIR
jgi:bifunctional UDP-N-acetylglucosamine pyrophosphorylase/glucosamine-1-phosphate N-acetyltransferase